jgi:hypothetical protein
MKQEVLERVQLIQNSMLQSALPDLEIEELDCLRGIVRITVEFSDYLQIVNLASPDEFDLEYMIGSICSGIDSFHALKQAYRVLNGSEKSLIRRETLAICELKELFLSIFEEFVKQMEFTKKCRLLLDLFKLEIVFAGAFYD